MATSVKLKQDQDVVGPTDPDHPGEYKLTTTFSDPLPVGGHWDACFILIKINDELHPEEDTYAHVCTVGDLEAYAYTVRADAVAHDNPYYRVDTWDLFYTSLEEMSAETTLQQERTQFLVDDWENYSGGEWPKTVYDDTISS